MARQQSKRPVVLVGEEANFAFDMRPKLQNGELITGTPTVVELTGTGDDLTITNKVRNSTATVDVENDDVPIDMAVTCFITGWVAGKVYRLLVTVVTDAPDPATRKDIFHVPSKSSS